MGTNNQAENYPQNDIEHGYVTHVLRRHYDFGYPTDPTRPPYSAISQVAPQNFVLRMKHNRLLETAV